MEPTEDKNTGNKILVAEDNDVNLSMLLDMLSIMKHKVVVARNGQEAIRIFQHPYPGFNS